MMDLADYEDRDEPEPETPEVLKAHLDVTRQLYQDAIAEVKRLRKENDELRTQYTFVLNEYNALKANRSAVYDV